MEFYIKKEKSFDNMSNTEADEYMHWYVENIDLGIKYLETIVNRTIKWSADYSDESFLMLSKWWLPNIIKEIIPLETVQKTIETQQLPAHIANAILTNREQPSPLITKEMYTIGMYFAKSIIVNLSDFQFEWKILHRSKKNIEYNIPKLCKIDPPSVIALDAQSVVANTTSRMHREQNELGLYSIYIRWKTMFIDDGKSAREEAESKMLYPKKSRAKKLSK
ncbi:MAG: hypothetical protein IPK18_08290 [Sphingobacteriales bacterium]|jgi:hypothetical protein|nr:MAG: hypothetical protein IPK18_08290 [Sphingobacteriales bacterium]